jgi:hypothetical protein
MNNISELVYRGKTYTTHNQIYSILEKEQFYWLIDSELSNAIVEIERNTIIWHDGIFLSGNWKYGIFKNGEFYGTWENGIFESGIFDGKWISGINLSKNN